MLAETPENAGYMIAAYVVAPVILVGYLVVAVGEGEAGGRTVGRSGRSVAMTR